jgi:ABC-type nitrate/sulfonate/bicarbonate transport system permease component
LSRKEIVRGCVSVFAGVSLWELLTTGLLLENQLFIPPPRSVLRIFWIPLLNGQFTKHFVATLLNLLPVSARLAVLQLCVIDGLLLASVPGSAFIDRRLGQDEMKMCKSLKRHRLNMR